MELNKIYNTDCVQGMHELVPDNFVDLIVTSPPYNLGIQYNDHQDTMSIGQYYAWCREWIAECFRVLKVGGRFCLQIGPFQPTINEPSYATFTKICQDVGFIFRELVIWDKSQIHKRTAWGSWASPSNPRILPPFELIINFHKGSPSIIEKGKGDLTSIEFVNWTNGIWKIAPASAKETGHPAPYPYELVKRCIKMHTYIGGVVMDPFIGSGTTAVVAHDLHRKWFGFEITKEYCDLSKDALSQKKLEGIDISVDAKYDEAKVNRVLQNEPKIIDKSNQSTLAFDNNNT